MRRTVTALAVVGVVVAACGGADPEAGAPVPEDGVPLCTDVPSITADPALYSDNPKYVGNEMPVDEVMAWAIDQPGYAGIWIDRDHNGWVTVAFTNDVDARQADIETMWPDDGVVAVSVNVSEADLAELQQRAHEEVPEVLQGSGTMINYGVLALHVGFLTDENIAAIEEVFAGEPVCIEGLDPSLEVPAGPQPNEGDGWRLLVDKDEVGEVYRTGIAWDQASLDEMIASIPGLDIESPEVDFETEVAIWFGAVHGSSCPNLRLDDVVVTGNLVHGEIVEASNQMACTDDAIPHTYLVAVDRDRLPEPPFHIQLSPGVPPAGVPEERTVVNADLRESGSTASANQVGGDPELPGQQVLRSGDFIEPGFPFTYEIDLSCGWEWLGEINSYAWRASAAVPPSWISASEGEAVATVAVTLNEGPEPSVEVSYLDETLVYEAVDSLPVCGG